MDDKDKEFERKLENNLDEIREGDAAGARIQEEVAKQPPVNEQTWQALMKQEQGERATITEAEARRMIDEEREKTVKGLKQANAKSKRTLVVVLVVAVILCVLGVVFALVMGNRKGEQTGESGENVPGQEVKPEEKLGEETGAEGTEVEELALDDELVQRLRGYFKMAGSPWDGRWSVYTSGDNNLNGSNRRSLMLIFARDNLETKTCNGQYSFTYNDGAEVKSTTCYAGEDMRQKIVEIFGEQMQFEESDVIGAECGGWHYSVEGDEFHEVAAGCGGMIPASVERVLVRAEKYGDEIILYEKVLFKVEMQFYQIDDLGSINENSKVIADLNDLGSYEDFADSEAYEEALAKRTGEILETYGDIFKWTFTKNADGEYVFSRLERIEK